MPNLQDVLISRPRLLWMVVALKRMRTKIGALLILACVVESFYFRERPFDLLEPNVWVILGGALILVGAMFRIAAFGCIRKKEQLATMGVYAFCRHPLYLGSMLIAYGFCMLLRDWDKWVIATAYFALFYTLTIAWEEVRLADRYGESYQSYRRNVPLLLPYGVFRSDGFNLGRAMRSGGWVLIASLVGLMGLVEVMARMMNAKGGN